MMRALFSAAPTERVRILRERKDISVAIHEAGHAFMGSAHNLLEWVELPSYDTGTNCLGGDAHTVLTKSKKRTEILADLYLSGFCAELCFLEAPNIHSYEDESYSRDTAACDDLMSFLTSTKLHDKVLCMLLNESNERNTKSMMKAIYTQYGEKTYQFLRNRRDTLIMLSSDIYHTWRIAGFKSTIWTM